MSENIDVLTHILNRKGLFEAFAEMSDVKTVNVLFFDVDNFKTVNDMYGHHAGDETLIKFADIIKNSVPEGTVVARLGGDEFVALVPGKMTRASVAQVAQDVLKNVRGLKNSDRYFDIISASIGIMLDYNVSDGLDGALTRSDKAMYYAKEQGKDNYTFYDDYEDIIDYENDIEKSAAKALDEGRFVIKYHPMHHLESSRLVCTEACCVWEREDGTTLGRNDYRSILLKSGFINKLDFFIFRQACRDLPYFKEVSRIKHRIGIQFSYLLLMDDNRINWLDEIMKEYGVFASDFEINLDESVFGRRTSISKVIQSLSLLREKGFSIALSRFGEDFSSVRYLKQLPVSAIKLDGDFILDNIRDEEGKQILKSIIKLGRGFKAAVSACKVDDEETLALIADCGFDAATGDCFSDKLTFEEYIGYLKKREGAEPDTITYAFKGDLMASGGAADGQMHGTGIEFVPGISSHWGAVRFPGGPIQANRVDFPSSLLDNSGITVSMWIKPLELQNWVSAFYVRYRNGFFSFMPNISGGRCMLRIKKDDRDNEWHDAMTSALNVGRWFFMTYTVDFMARTARLYIDGEPEAVITGIPELGAADEVMLGGDVFQDSFKGLVSAVQINNTALESYEIKSRYDSFCKEPGFMGGKSEDEEGEDIVIHDPAIFEDSAGGRFYIYSTGAQGYSSADLVHWKALGKVVGSPPAEAVNHTGSEAIWAPDIVKVGNEYRLYCSNSSWGVNKSCIFLATSDKPEGPFAPTGIVVQTGSSDPLNAIDANIIEDHKTGEQYMVYGSFWSGIYILKLDKSTGLAGEEGFGKLIAGRPLWNDGAIEGPYVIYHPETEYYYLFVSYGSLRSDYNIRVGRSRKVTGPYLDFNGRDMVAYDDDAMSTGLMIDCGYRYLTGQAYMGPGHNSVLLRDNGDMYLVSHIRRLAFNTDPGPGVLQIRKMVMSPDGWPIALGQPINGKANDEEIPDEKLIGNYERIELRPAVPQGIAHAHPMSLLAGGRLEMASAIGSWRRADRNTLELKYGPITEFVHFENGFCAEKNIPAVIMGGLTDRGICTWATK